MPQPGPSPVPESSRYSLEVLRVDGIQRRSRKGQLSVELAVDSSFKIRVDIEHSGKPTQNATLLFSQIGSSSIIDVSLKQYNADADEQALGHAEIKEDVPELLHRSLPYEFKRNLTHTPRSSDIRRRVVTAGTIYFRLDLTDPWERAELCVNMAERRLEDMGKLADKVASTDSVISTVIKAVDQIKDIVDVVAEIHPLIELSWKAVTVVYRVVTFQFETDAKLVDMAGKMKDAFRLSAEAHDLDDRTKMLLKSKIKSLLDETAKCSRLVQEYAARSFTGRLIHWKDRHKIDEFKDRFEYLRKELDSVITVNIGKGVDDIGFRQVLETLVDPAKMDISKMSTRARCLEGTREDYLNEIMSLLLPDQDETVVGANADMRIVWLTGAAGVGKSTIALTIADACDSKGSPAAYLFFERGKDEYIYAIRAIAYRLAKLYPSLRSHIARAVGEDGNISGRQFKTQFEGLVLSPIRAASIGQPIVIILDALDECGAISDRQELVSLLMNDFAHLPSHVRVLVTSRPDSDIANHLPSKCHIHHIRLEHASPRDRQDVDRYIKQTIVAIVEQGPPKGWEWDGVCWVLSNAAGGLFIWASTAIKMIRDSSNRRRKLRTLLEDIKSVGGGIDGLYATVLQTSGISWDEPETRSEFVRVLGAILFGKEALSGEDIESLLGLEEDTVDTILKPLRSVLFYEPGNPVRLHHASFADYLTSERSGGRPWHIDESAQKHVIAERCFATVESNLHFNMCRFASSFQRNDDIPDLADRVKFRIPPYLKYACLHWAQHLNDVPYSSSLLRALSDFAYQRLLFWFEVLSLTKVFGRVAVDALSVASGWSELHGAGITSFLRDARKLATIFVFPITTSTPHIYVTMVPLEAGDSEVAVHYSKWMASPVRIDRIGVQRPPLCLKVLEGHNEPVLSVAFAPNGKYLASVSEYATIKVWNIDSGDEIFTPLKGCAVCFSLEGDRIVTGSWDGTLSVWDARNGDLILGPLEEHTGKVNSVACSSDGRRMASGSEDRHVIVWDGDGKVTFRLEGHTQGVTSVAFSPDSTRFASGSSGGVIRVWSMGSGQLTFGPFGAGSGILIDPFFTVAFSPNGGYIVSGSGDGTIKIREVESGNVVSALVGVVTSVAYSPCGTHIVSGSSNKIKVWDAESGSIVRSLEGHTHGVYSVAVSADGKYIASGSHDETIRIWDAAAATNISKTSAKHPEAVNSVAFSPDGSRIASASRDRSVIVWDAETGNVALGPLLGHEDGVTCVAFLPDGSRLLSGSRDGAIRIWDAKTGESVADPLLYGCEVFCIALSPDGTIVASGSWIGTISVWNIATGQLVAQPIENHSDSVTSVAFSANGKQLASGSDDKTVIIWSTDDWVAISRLTGHSEIITSVSFSSDGTLLAFGAENGSVVTWDIESGQKVAELDQGHEITAVACSLNGIYVISGSRDETIRVWNVKSGRTVCELEGHSDWVRSLALSPDGRRVVSGSHDATIRVWDLSDTLQHSVEDAEDTVGSSSEWVLGRDGWVLGGQDQHDLLTWIPPDLRNTLWQPRTTAVMSCDFYTKLDFVGAAIGTGWTECFVRPESRN